jgi:hypothetical protein
MKWYELIRRLKEEMAPEFWKLFPRLRKRAVPHL